MDLDVNRKDTVMPTFHLGFDGRDFHSTLRRSLKTHLFDN